MSGKDEVNVSYIRRQVMCAENGKTMSRLFILAATTISLAFVFYTIGVFAERHNGVLKKWHTAIFWLGFAFDTTGTTLMGKLAGTGFKLDFHGITGMIALSLMAFHALWATVIIIRDNEEAKQRFHKFSIFVWAIWLIPYIGGMFIGFLG